MDLQGGRYTDGRSALIAQAQGQIDRRGNWDITNLIDLEPASGTYIYSASEAYDEEQRFDHERLNHWLDLFRLTKVGGLPGAEQGPFHASGHIDGPGME